jgi:hypothetical protein
MRVTGFSLVANAERLDFPVREALRSLLPLVDELIVNVGPSDDGTRELVASLADPRLRIIEGAWDPGQGSAVLAIETQRALDRAQGDWAIYIQADEVLHEAGIPALRQAMTAAQDDPRVEGLLVDFVHFYGSPRWVGRGRAWYRREVRIVRPGIGVRSFQDAQGFRVNGRRIRARASGAAYHHYGWARPLPALAAKQEVDTALYHGGTPRRLQLQAGLPWDVGLTSFRGTHPEVMRDWLAARQGRFTEQFTPRRWDARRLALLASLGVERLTGWRPFEYRNYEEV